MQLIVNGTELNSGIIKQAKASYSILGNEGLIVLNGTIELANAGNGGLVVLDPAENSLWTPGNVLELKESSIYLPIIGYSIIQYASYEPALEILTLQISCWLGYTNRITPKGLAICAKFDYLRGINESVQEILIKAGIPATSASRIAGIPGTLYEPLFIRGDESLVRMAGRLAHCNGFCLYQDNAGKIVAQDITNIPTLPSINLADSQLLSYSNISDTDLSPNKLMVSASQYYAMKPINQPGIYIDLDKTVFENEAGGTSIEINRPARTITRKAWKKGYLYEIAPQLYPAAKAGFIPSLITDQGQQIEAAFKDLIKDTSFIVPRVHRFVHQANGITYQIEYIVTAKTVTANSMIIAGDTTITSTETFPNIGAQKPIIYEQETIIELYESEPKVGVCGAGEFFG